MNTNLATNNYNVVGLNNNSVQSAINAYFEGIMHNSKRTYSSYKSHIKQFCLYFFNKEIEDITWEDVTNRNKLNFTNLKNYRNYLTDSNSNKTVNIKFIAIKGLFKELSHDREDIKPIVEKFNDLERLSEKKEKNSHYGALTIAEIKNLYEYCKKQNNGLTKYLYFKTLYITAIRKTALLNLTWNDISKQLDFSTKKLMWTINVIDKGQAMNPVAIRDDFYEELCSLKTENTKPTDKVFKICEQYVYDTLYSFCDEYGIDKKNRKISIHSLKHSSVDEAYKLSNNDINVAKDQGKHADVSTTMIYINAVSLSNQMSLRIDEKIDTEDLRNATQEELYQMILAQGTSFIVQSKEGLKQLKESRQ